MDSLNAESLFVNRYHPIESLDSQYGLTEVKQRNLRNLNAAFFRRPHAEKFEADKLFDGACFKGYLKVTHRLFFLREGLIRALREH